MVLSSQASRKKASICHGVAEGTLPFATAWQMQPLLAGVSFAKYVVTLCLVYGLAHIEYLFFVFGFGCH